MELQNSEMCCTQYKRLLKPKIAIFVFFGFAFILIILWSQKWTIFLENDPKYSGLRIKSQKTDGSVHLASTVCALVHKKEKSSNEKLVWPLCRYTLPEKCLVRQNFFHRRLSTNFFLSNFDPKNMFFW
jgi:hypothetical protein